MGNTVTVNTHPKHDNPELDQKNYCLILPLSGSQLLDPGQLKTAIILHDAIVCANRDNEHVYSLSTSEGCCINLGMGAVMAPTERACELPKLNIIKKRGINRLHEDLTDAPRRAKKARC